MLVGGGADIEMSSFSSRRVRPDSRASKSSNPNPTIRRLPFRIAHGSTIFSGNRPFDGRDGWVEVLARVDSASKPRLLAALREGPRMARVERLNVQTLQDDGTCPEQEFLVRY